MIVSDFESVAIRLLLGGALEAHSRGALSFEAGLHVLAFADQLEAPGTTSAAQAEIDAGKPVRSGW